MEVYRFFYAILDFKTLSMKHLLAILLLIGSQSFATDTVKISMKNAITTNNSKFEGWGTSLCWWANRVGYSDTLSQQCADLFFGDNGLRLNIMRYNIGGGDNPAHHHIKRTDSAIPGWMTYDSVSNTYSYNCQADSNQINVLRRSCKAAGQDAYIEVFSNSPPYFWTASGCSSGNFDTSKDNLRPDCYTLFADYLAYVTKYIQDSIGLKVKSISPMNESSTNFWWAYSDKQEGCHFNAGESQSKLLTETAKALKSYNLNEIILAACDETGPKHQINACLKFSDEARSVVNRISTHTYDTSGRYELGQLAKQYPNIWMSEIDGGAILGDSVGEMGASLWLAQRIIDDITGLGASAWVLWQVIDNHISKVGYNGNKDKGMVNLNRGYWGVAVANHDDNCIVLTQKYYGFGQFSRFIRPGATIIRCGQSSLAAYDSEISELVIVAINKEPENKQVEFDLSDFEGKIGVYAKTFRTSGTIADGEHWAEIGQANLDNNMLKAEIKGYSITTFVINCK